MRPQRIAMNFAAVWHLLARIRCIFGFHSAPVVRTYYLKEFSFCSCCGKLLYEKL